MSSLLMRRLCIKSPISLMTRRLNVRLLQKREAIKEIKLKTIKDIVMERHSETNGNIDWKPLIEQMVEQRLLFKHNFEMDLMLAFIKESDSESHKMDEKLYKSMNDLIKQSPNISNSILMSRYCHFISHFNNFMDKTDNELLRQESQQLMDKYIANKITYEVIVDCIKGLAKSSKDNCLYAIKLWDQLNRSDSHIIKHFIDYSIHFKCYEQSLDLINKYSNIELSNEMISKIICTLFEWNLTNDQLIDLLKLFSKNLIVFDIKVKSKLIELLNKYSFKSKFTYIRSDGLCRKCDQTLKGLSITEIKTLTQEFREVMFDKENDIFMKSFPEYERELKNFDKMIRKLTANKPLDLVIDGLNVAFSTQSEITEDKTGMRQYVQTYSTEKIDANVVEMLEKNEILKNYENILIIGRKHMQRWKQLNQLLVSEKDKISMFYAMNKTQDDIYCLYGAIQSPNSYLISNDFYRNHLNKMAIRSSLFERWLKTHLMLIKDKKCFVKPVGFDAKIQFSSDDKIIHIPFNESNNSLITWICFQRSS